MTNFGFTCKSEKKLNHFRALINDYSNSNKVNLQKITQGVSVVIPYYRKKDFFKKAFEQNKVFLERQNVQVILVLDEPTLYEDIDYFLESDIDYLVIVNDCFHNWRNPCLPINIGVLNARHYNVIVLSPESLMLDDSIYNLIKNKTDNNCTIGYVGFVAIENLNLIYKDLLFQYGSICFNKDQFHKVGGYSIKFNEYGGEDTDFRQKLRNKNFDICSVETYLLHLENNEALNQRYKKPEKFGKTELYREICQNINNKYTLDEISESGFRKVSKNEILQNKHILFDKNVLDLQYKNISQSYQIVSLTPVYNGVKYLKSFLKSQENLVDGYIILDDDSNDNSYEYIDHKNVILKLKKIKTEFSEALFRNLLLKCLNLLISKNIKIDFVIWLDVDEIIHNKYLEKLLIKKSLNEWKGVGDVNLFHMWKDNFYNASYPYSNQGHQIFPRIFKNNNFPYSLNVNIKMHFNKIPYKYENTFNSKIIIRHYGKENEELRRRKYKFYSDTDTDKVQNSYEHIINNNPQLADINLISVRSIDNFNIRKIKSLKFGDYFLKFIDLFCYIKKVIFK